MEYEFTNENFNKEVMNSDIPVMVDFYAKWCGPCRMMLPIVEQMAEKYGKDQVIATVLPDRAERYFSTALI